MNFLTYSNYSEHTIDTATSATIQIPTARCIYDAVYNINAIDKKELPHNCVNCGAPLDSDVCEYCGTKY